VAYRFVACQSFAGGFDVGAVQAGWELVHKVEQPGGFGLANCERNRDVLGQNWEGQACDYNAWHAPHADAVFANPPCSGFSVMTDQRFRGVDAKVNQCMYVLMRYAARIRPQVVVMESVRAAYSQGRDLMIKLRAELEEQSGLRYGLWHVYQNAHELGGAANRPRYFLVASQVPFGVEYPNVRRPVLADVIGDLAGLGMTWEAQPYRRPETWWTEPVRSPTGLVDGHVASRAPYVQRAVDLYEANGGWPEGHHIAKVARAYWKRTGCLPESWAHLVEKLVGKDFNMGYTSMTRWKWNSPGRVITGGALGLVMHPLEPRVITQREAARIMGFPDDWKIRPLRGVSGLSMTWGKGITTQCGRWIANWTARAIDGTPGTITGRQVGDREWFIKP